MKLTHARPSYDELHYVGRPYMQTHPDRMAALGHLYGMRPAPAERCRVLELACGDGANLIPMAHALPESTFLGVDFAAEPLIAGQELAAKFDLKNLRLEVCDILDFPPDAGQFDYIIAHGFYSWCPPEVRDRLLAVCAAHLAPQGIAYVSFNAYPGYHAKELQRQLMLFHLANGPAGTAEEQANRSLEALRLIANAQPENEAHRFILEKSHEQYAEAIARGRAGLAWFHHDLISRYNHPVYFHEFMDHAGGHGLQFLSDAFLREPRTLKLSAEVRAALQAVQGDIIRQEQYLDFVNDMAFRRVLLCHDDVKIDRTLGPSAMQDLYVAGTMFPEKTDGGVDADGQETFIGPAAKVTVKQHESKETLRVIAAAWPGSVSFGELLARTEGGAASGLSEFLLLLCGKKMINFRVRPTPCCLTISERPVASAVAREQARTEPMVTNLQHEVIVLEVPARRFLQLLDGTRDHAQLLEAMRGWIASGEAAEEYRQLRETYPEMAKNQAENPPALDTLEADMNKAFQALLNASVLVG